MRFLKDYRLNLGEDEEETPARLTRGEVTAVVFVTMLLMAASGL